MPERTDEEVRAVEYRQKEALRARRRTQLEAGMAGDKAAYTEVLHGTAPMMRDHTPDLYDPEDDSGVK